MKLTLRMKLYSAFAVVVCLMGALGVVAIVKMGSISGRSDMLAEHVLPKVVAIKQVDGATMDYRGVQYEHVAAVTAADKQVLTRTLVARAAAVTKGFADFRRVATDPADLVGLRRTQAAWATYLGDTRQLVGLSSSGQRQRAGQVLKRANPQYDRVQSDIDRWAADASADATKGAAASRATYASGRMVTVGLLIAAVVLAGVVAFLIARGVVNGVKRMLSAAERIGEGDLTVDVSDVRSRDEIGEMAGAFQRMTEKLRATIGTVNETAGTLSAASQQMASTSEEAGRAVGEIASAVTDVAAGAERQVRAVEEAKASAEEVVQAVQESADNARRTAEAAGQAREVAEQGVAAAHEATDAMRAVRESTESVTGAIGELAAKSEQIGGIVEAITSIAGQTNLLALNAAIEAARAGEHGRGFAVVAEEVRKLAEESQQAATQIADLIEQIQAETQRVVEVVEDGSRRTETGAETVEQTREAFLAIGRSVEDVTARIEQIASASQQISAGAGKMQEGMGEVATVAEASSAATEQVSASTQQTSASTQEIAASAQELARNAEGLAQLVAQFKLAG
jgi:methyl-accepting chemotaxis protein